jgi:hypothetical protein
MGSIRKQLWPNCLGSVRKTEKSVSIPEVHTKVLIDWLQIQVRSIITTASLLSVKQLKIMLVGKGPLLL